MSIWKTTVTLEQLQARTRDTLSEHLGIRYTEIAADYLRATMPVDHRTHQPTGILHGGASVALAESLGSVAANLCVDMTTQVCVGQEINANHLRPISSGLVTATARPFHVGTRSQVWHIEIADEHGRLVVRITPDDGRSPAQLIAMPDSTLLGPDEPPSFTVANAEGRSNFVILVDHASNRIPRRLGSLGLPPAALQRHIAWDIGALAVARQVAAQLDAPLIAQNYSRLVIDCNRDPGVESSIPTLSEWSTVPGNLELTAEQAAARRYEIFDPYHAYIRALLDTRLAAGRPTILIAQHSMTDCYKGVRRAMHAAILYNRDRRFAGLMLEMLGREKDVVVGDNEPYFVSDETDYAIPRHGELRGLPHVEIEVRQDLISDEPGQTEWALRIERALRDAEQAFPASELASSQFVTHT